MYSPLVSISNLHITRKTLKNSTTELKSYSGAVKKSNNEQVTLKKIKTAAKDIVEDRSRNIMMFGLEETERENLDHKVKDIFRELFRTFV